MDTTTLQVQKKTKKVLDGLKENMGSKTYDELIIKLVMKKTPSIAGKLGRGHKFTMEKLMHGLRDKDDRF